MRAIKSILYILIVTSIISACMSVNDDDIYVSSDINDYQIEIKSTDYPNIETCVTEKDINDYLNYKRLAYADKQLEYSVKSVDPITHDGNKILAYEIISNQGWELISGDKRSDLLIAYSKNPSTSLGKQPEAAKIWINQYLNFVETLLDYPDFRGSSVYEEEQIKSNIDFWGFITADSNFISSHTIMTKSDPGSRPIDGYWVLVDTETEYEDYDGVDHLIETQWGDSFPFNDACPLQPNGLGRIKACSDQVAGTQYLYFMHYKIGVPQLAPSSGDAHWVPDTTGIGHHYLSFFSDYSSSIWDEMDSSLEKTAYLIGDIGKLLGVIYSPYFNNIPTEPSTYSSLFNSLSNNVLPAYGLTCSPTSFDRDDVLDSINSGYPVLINAARDRISNNSHNFISFIADAYKRTRLKVTNTYEWVWSDPEGEQSIVFPLEDISYSLPSPPYFGFNWGDGTCCDTWYVSNGPWNYNSELFQYDIKMLLDVETL